MKMTIHPLKGGQHSANAEHAKMRISLYLGRYLAKIKEVQVQYGHADEVGSANKQSCRCQFEVSLLNGTSFKVIETASNFDHALQLCLHGAKHKIRKVLFL